MKNLLTRKIVLGMLMTLVLALGVQGRADAITKITKSASRDHQVVSIGQEFTISFSVGVTGSRLKANYKTIPSTNTDGDAVTIDRTATPYYMEDGTPGYLDETGVTRAAAHNYDEEAIAISSDPTTMTLRKGNTPLTLGSSVRSLSEDAAESDMRLSNSVTLKGVATEAGRYAITITDVTEDADFPSNTRPVTHTPAPTTTFIIYVWQNVSDSRGATITTGLSDGIAQEFGTVLLRVTLTQGTNSTFARVEFEVTRGPGRLYEDKDGNGKADKSASTRLTTFTNNGGTANVAEVVLIPNRGTSHVRAWISGNPPDAEEDKSTEAIYAYGYSQLRKVSGDSPEQSGPASSRLENPFVVQLLDQTGRTTIPGATITFDVLSGDGSLAKDPSFSDDLYADDFPATATMETDSSGRASVFLVLGASGDQSVTATDGRNTVTFEASIATGTDARTPHFIGKVASTDGQRADEFGVLEDALTVIVRDQLGDLLLGATVEFEARDGGTLSNPDSTKGDPGTVPQGNGVDTDSRRRDIVTNTSGEASVRYTAPDSSGRKTVTATLEDGTRRFVTFTVNGAPSTGTITPPPTTPPPTTTNPTLTLSQSSIEGAGGSRQTLTATLLRQTGVPAVGIGVTFALSTSASGGVDPAIDITDSNGQAQTTIILPSSSASVTVDANVDGTSLRQTASITITGAGTGTGTGTQTTTRSVGEPSRISISGNSSLTGEVNRRLDNDLSVRVVDSNGLGVIGEVVSFRVTEGRGRLSPARPRTDNSGYAEAGFTPLSTGTIEIQAVLGNLSPVTFTITTGEPPDAIKKISGDNQSGRPGARLANPFVVEVVDENDDPVSGTTVTFAVTAGGGSVSPTSATTNNSGRAQTTLTLGDAIGDNTVSARVTGLTAVTFKAGAGAEVHVSASDRAPIYWIDKQNGTLHRLVDDDVENLASNVEGVTSIAVDAANGLLYWGVQVGRSGGKIQRSRLNGRSVETLKNRLTSVPMGIALDGSGSTIYWTSASGKIRSMATEGSTKVTKIIEDLADPMSLAVSNGYLYWAEPLGRVRRVSLTASRKVAANIATGLGEPLSIAIARGKIYWVERSNGGGGALQRANLNGTNIEELKAFTGGVPLGISIDSSDNKIYWTKLSKIQRTNLAGRSVTDVVTGLTRPSAIALGKTMLDEPVVTETKKPKTTKTTTTTTTTYSKYDINKDGTVNNADTKAVAGAVGQSGAAITNPRTDIDGSGMVDVTDLILVIANLDDDVAAPAIDVDLTAMDLDFDRVQEQIEVLLASGDRSHAAQRALMYLQHLLASARPDVTVLLANYPNPFNPETWIPYHLATSTDVKINIYNAQGILVRALTLGHQSAGYYTSRSRAAYWDGRNALGERVASGIYFYQLQADEISPLRKMVILK